MPSAGTGRALCRRSICGGSFCQIFRMVGNVHDAQDLTQEAFIKALQRQDQLRDELKAAHWLSRIATNTALDFLRRTAASIFCEIS